MSTFKNKFEYCALEEIVEYEDTFIFSLWLQQQMSFNEARNMSHFTTLTFCFHTQKTTTKSLILQKKIFLFFF